MTGPTPPRRPPLTRRTAEHLLRRDSRARAGRPDLADLLDAAAAPARPAELAGRTEALAGFRTRPSRRRRPHLASLLTVKAAAAAVLTAATGGAALAAATGALPVTPHPATTTFSPAATSSPSESPSAADHTFRPPRSTAPPAPSASPRKSCSDAPLVSPRPTGDRSAPSRFEHTAKPAGCPREAPTFPPPPLSPSPNPFPSGGTGPREEPDCQQWCPPAPDETRPRP
ncbi:hypothetical protein [Paractinoplanes rishiriensis]|uniref:Uncharacterized protein n=1 Tax=Paractinoplanes rishiriensis TaxID=1050105 RepID=A0A919N1Y1_9ACTN|nr:hypothetical protein [Actinoplanes rishiriensis]GIE98107.1 hypothetical protein Ari01nite_55720 [Actinoplanes rishiriensis]